MDKKGFDLGGLGAFMERYAKPIDWITICGGWVGAVVLLFAHVPPGWAIGLLALVAAIMTFSHPTGWQRALVIVLAGFLFYIETSAITKDRKDQEAKHVADMGVLNAQLSTILTNNRTGMATILSNAQDNFGKAQRQITGGNSFVYIQPITSGGIVGLSARNDGRYALTGVSVFVAEVNSERHWNTSREIGTVSPDSAQLIPIALLTPTPDKTGVDSYIITISEQNGQIFEKLWIRKSQTTGAWEHKYRVWRQILGKRQDAYDRAMVSKLLMAKDTWIDDTTIPPAHF